MRPLSADGIRGCIADGARARLDALEVFAELESTNSYLLGQACPSPGRYRVALAEHQTHGRGRMNRGWISPPSSGLCMSLAFTFARQPNDFASLSLAVGIAVVKSLEGRGVEGLGLKWPNDLVLRDGKLGGILVEVHPQKNDGVTVVAGIGINVDLRHDATASGITSSLGGVADLASCCDQPPPRADIAVAIIENLVDAMDRFDKGGFATFHSTWREYDWLHGREVTVEGTTAASRGIAEGVDFDGALLLSADGAQCRITSGSVVVNDLPGARP